MMTRERRAQIATVAVLLIAFGIGAVRKAGWRMPDLSEFRRARQAQANPPQEPQDVIYVMQDAARAGDVRTYLASYTGQMEAALRQTLAGTTENAFAQYLRDSTTAIRGIAVAEPEKITDAEAKVRVEYVYQDRNQVQTMYLEKGANGWKISGLDTEERVKTLIPYGMPVK
jgi:hypothetical protein